MCGWVANLIFPIEPGDIGNEMPPEEEEEEGLPFSPFHFLNFESRKTKIENKQKSGPF